MVFVTSAASKMELTRALGSINVSAELPASITREQTPSACVPYYFNQARNTTKTACIYIINDKTVAFIPTQNGITVFDNHYHGTSAAFLATAPTGAEWELLSWFKSINSVPHSLLGTVRSVTFRWGKLIDWFNNRTGTSFEDARAHGIVWTPFYFDYIWVFLMRAPLSNDVPVLLLNQPNINFETTEHYLFRNSDTSQSKIYFVNFQQICALEIYFSANLFY